MNGEFVEIEPGVTVFFRGMPLADAEVIDRYTALKSALSACVLDGDVARAQLFKKEGQLQTRTEAYALKHAHLSVDGIGNVHRSLGDGRDFLKAAPKLREQVRMHEKTVAELERREGVLRREISHLERWYPVTIIRWLRQRPALAALTSEAARS